ncbi:MAG: hypothetical protein Kow0099_32770 [Candidatus Abyssubacteria bacterium]
MATVKGVIIPVDWDRKGNVVAVAIATQDEDEYRIDSTGKGKELLGFIREEIHASGEVTEQEGKKVIRIAKYSFPKAQNRENIRRVVTDQMHGRTQGQ